MSFATKKLSLGEALQSARETRALEIGQNILGKTPEVFRQHFQNRSAVIVSDTNSFAIAGEKAARFFAEANHNCEKPFIFDDADLYAEFKFVEKLEAALMKHDAIPIAVGSGTLNDLTKLVAHQLGRPYLCVATAASMDGYTAFGASITYRGSKQTFNCPAPTAVVADIEIIRNAPKEMTASGYADLLAKNTAGADWIVSDALGIEPIDQQAWNIVQGGLRESLSNPVGAKNGEANAIFQLTEGLMLGGFAMQWAKSSRPASGAEHQFSHLWDMQHHTHNGVAPSHGFKVGIGTLAVTALYEFLFTRPLQDLDVDACCANWPDKKAVEANIKKLFPIEELAQKSVEETHAKWIDVSQLRSQLNQLKNIWPDLKQSLQQHLIPFAELKQMLREVGAPTEPEQIGITRARLRDSYRQAYFIRRRFTVLDLAMRVQLLEKSLDFNFGRNGIWPL